MVAFRHLALPFCLSLAALSWSGPARAELVRIYVTNRAGDSVGARVYVSNEHERTLDVFDRVEGNQEVNLSDRPNNIAVANDGRIVVGIARSWGARHRRPEDAGTARQHSGQRPSA